MVARPFVATAVLFAEKSFVGEQDAVVGLIEFGVRQRVGQESRERRPGLLFVQPFQRFLMDEVAGILGAFLVLGSGHAVLNILFERNAGDAGIAGGAAVAVQKVRVVGMGLELADVAVELVDATLVGG